MPDYIAPLRDMRFVLNEVLDYPGHLQSFGQYAEIENEMVDAILVESAKFCEQTLSPLNRIGDEQGCRWQDGQVATPAGFADAYRQFVASGWVGISQDPALGGQGLPVSLSTVVYEMLAASNHAWSIFITLSWGAINTIRSHASDALQQRFLPEMVAGNWTGTMCLTEPHCGSDLGLLRTKATPNDDGSYAITGSKMFISTGEHDMSDNIIHLVLARLPDAPEGVKGISLFIVPKLWVDDDGVAGLANGVSCGSIEHKMGLNGNPTCVMNFDAAKGFLIGEAHRGMSAMFTFINESRLAVSQQAHGNIEGAYQGALRYARERRQMRAPVRALPQEPADPIIVHPDVRRMLLTQKSLSEGARALIYHCAKLVDVAHASPDDAARSRADAMLALLTPIVKGFVSEMSIEASSLGVQVFGGHGVIREWGMEQHCRDTRVTAIYEGTSGIQGLDLLGRKILASDGQLLQTFVDEIRVFCGQCSNGDLAEMANQLLDYVYLWQKLTLELGEHAKTDVNAVGAASYDYLMIAGYVTVAYFWLRAATASSEALAAGSDELAFYRGKLSTARFYYERLLPRCDSLAQAIRSGSSNVMDVPEFAL